MASTTLPANHIITDAQVGTIVAIFIPPTGTAAQTVRIVANNPTSKEAVISIASGFSAITDADWLVINEAIPANGGGGEWNAEVVRGSGIIAVKSDEPGVTFNVNGL